MRLRYSASRRPPTIKFRSFSIGKTTAPPCTSGCLRVLSLSRCKPTQYHSADFVTHNIHTSLNPLSTRDSINFSHTGAIGFKLEARRLRCWWLIHFRILTTQVLISTCVAVMTRSLQPFHTPIATYKRLPSCFLLRLHTTVGQFYTASLVHLRMIQYSQTNLQRITAELVSRLETFCPSNLS